MVYGDAKIFNCIFLMMIIITRTRLRRDLVSPAWRLDREMRKRLILQET